MAASRNTGLSFSTRYQYVLNTDSVIFDSNIQFSNEGKDQPLIVTSICSRSRYVEIGNLKLGVYALVQFMNVFNFGPSLFMITLYSVAFDSNKTFLRMSFRNHDLVSTSELLDYK